MVRGTYAVERRLIPLALALAGPGTPACVAVVEMGEPGVGPASIGIPEPAASTAVAGVGVASAGVGVAVASTAVPAIGVPSTVPGMGVPATGGSRTCRRTH